MLVPPVLSAFNWCLNAFLQFGVPITFTFLVDNPRKPIFDKTGPMGMLILEINRMVLIQTIFLFVKFSRLNLHKPRDIYLYPLFMA